MIDMYDLPTESELLGQAMLESSKKNSNDIDQETFFPFWTPKGPQSAAVKLGDKTGVVKDKVDFNPGEVRIDKVWEDFLKAEKAKEKKAAKPVTGIDAFGSVVIDTLDKQPKPEKLTSSLKALKKVTEKSIEGKVNTTVEELGVAKFVEVSKAQKPGKGDHTGIVEPKSAMGKQKVPTDIIKEKPEVSDVSGATTVVKSFDETLKASPNNVVVTSEAAKPGKGDHTGIVEPKSAMGKQKVPDEIIKGKTVVNEVGEAKTVIAKSYDTKLQATPNNVVIKSEAAKPGKGDHTGIVEPKSAMGKQKVPTAIKG